MSTNVASTNFFAQQARARQASSYLLFLLFLAVASIILAVCVAIHILYPALPIGGQVDALVVIAVTAAIAVGTLVRMLQIGSNGSAVAAMLGGVLISPATRKEEERRLLNVVEEMAIASGIPAPRVYMQMGEGGINAFAAGMKPSTAVICVTQGAVDRLTRDELQGIVAHEFSHIFNGDMRLNVQLLGILGGILGLTSIGRVLIESGGRRTSRARRSGNDGAAIFAIGVFLIFVGYVGAFFARLIKSAVSRQREFLADASAVQFTRNPEGIGGALAKIAGNDHHSAIMHPMAEELSHFYFAAAMPAATWFATHPPIEERLKRIGYINFSAPTAPVAPTAQVSPFIKAASAGLSAPASSASMPLAAAAIINSIGSPTARNLNAAKSLLASLPPLAREAARDPQKAQALFLSLLISESQPAVKSAQLGAVADPTVRILIEQMASAISTEDKQHRLSLVDLCLPVLRAMSLEDRSAFITVCRKMVEADQETNLFEYVALTLLKNQLFTPSKRPLRPSNNDFIRGIAVLLSAVAYAGAKDQALANNAFAAGCAQLTRLQLKLKILPADECKPDQLARVVNELRAFAPMIISQVVTALVTTVTFDRVITRAERELLRAVCSTLEAPMPALYGELV